LGDAVHPPWDGRAPSDKQGNHHENLACAKRWGAATFMQDVQKAIKLLIKFLSYRTNDGRSPHVPLYLSMVTVIPSMGLATALPAFLH
jgi:hypothetical protein